MKKVFVGIVISFCMGIMATPAQAVVTLNFDAPEFVPNTTSGDHAHTYSTAYGDVTFNGRIWNKLAGAVFPDHTTGQDYFLKNTGAESRVTMLFDFDVTSLTFYWVGLQGVTMHGAIYDAAGNMLDSNDPGDTGIEAWQFIDVGGYASPIRSIAFWTDGGNKMAIDDLNLIPSTERTVPEPASMALLGSGLVGVFTRRRKK